MELVVPLQSYASQPKFDLLPFVARGIHCLWSLIRWKIKVLDLFGVKITLHSSVVALPGVLAACHGWSVFVSIYVLGIYATILMHEIGHAVGGHLTGNRAREICITGFGGYTVLSRIPGATGGDALMSLFGPLANLLTCVLLPVVESILYGGSPVKWTLVLLSEFMGYDTDMPRITATVALLNSLAVFNLYVFLFNLLPAVPLDGGRVFRWFCGRHLPPLTAAKVTMFVSRASAIMVVALAIVTDVIFEWIPSELCFLCFVAVWIWLGGIAEVWRTEECAGVVRA